ncbi:division/cell wall cluster transcriptional repressor MraZ [Conexibacter sp. DBS9H8]|uniref:division/cell wall cluster transcriptional repressor MraZ n=1 Tax=Conexibacter sp. DBS9H8 TaxID=2937801 RepID=UPI00201068F1|nr:division/cell wall cluster transcriptional repressor MraZ [Conexibacter sp. DBS9H8]
MNFRGTFEHSLDAKHRLTVPSKFRSAFADGVVLAIVPGTTADTPRSIAMWTPTAYEAYTSVVLEGLNPMSPRARELKRLLFANSQDVELDSANRVMIPPQLMAFAGLDKEAVIAGAGECLEIWDRTAYTTYNEGALARFSDIAASFDHTP